ncbi:MAG: TIGR01212 family radical SAM protein [Syntrophales bacterium]|jgi:radical SAM protein (TIGR01212 family)|nr:TIGR01212 family radical SAM protein [Syntrophales bacterium]MCK9527117.1 TIGR01212 family radical SAM protein [Syntrophales bacterium]MDX9921758.1 TIGR01212 family radical SAM protein [Syntrophales bacterium]
MEPNRHHSGKRYRDLKSFFFDLFGCRVFKIQIDAGFTCPNRDGSIACGGCIYCDGRYSRLRQSGPLPTVSEQIAAGRELYRRIRGATQYIAYFQTASNTYGSFPHLKALYDEALAQEGVLGISVGTRPDCIADDVIDLLQRYADQGRHVWIEYGLQSAHDRTLRAINRGHDAAAFVDTVERTAGRGIYICAHIILGLPGESGDDMMRTARFLADLPIDGIKIHLLLALDGTEAGRLYRTGALPMMTREEYVSTVVDILEVLPPKIVIQRLTADGYRDIFLAPEWGKNKLAVLNAIDDELDRRNTFQGAALVHR